MPAGVAGSGLLRASHMYRLMASPSCRAGLAGNPAHLNPLQPASPATTVAARNQLR